ncbi:MAG TPA: universal stress protein [Steroidobacteraceae bacterium]|nr:universal stress protein [Steroidobacteraceae bacterium]
MEVGRAVSPLHRIMVATDFSSAGHAAVARAAQLADQNQSLLAICHATPDWTLFSERAQASQEHYTQITRNADELMRRELSWVASRWRLTQVRGEVVRGRAAAAIAQAMDAFQPDLMVVGAGGEHVLPGGAAVLGGTALKLISRVTLPVLLVRGEEAPGPYESTLAAVPRDARVGLRLVRWATTLVGSGDCHVVRAYDAPYEIRMRLCGYDDAVIALATENQRLMAQQDCASLQRLLTAGRLTVHVVRGTPLETVLAQVAEHSPQLVVVGQHQRRPDEHSAGAAGLGTRLAYHCPTDVLMVP